MTNLQTPISDGQGNAIYALVDCRTNQPVTLLYQTRGGQLFHGNPEQMAQDAIFDLAENLGCDPKLVDRVSRMGEKVIRLMDKIGHLSNWEIDHLIELAKAKAP